MDRTDHLGPLPWKNLDENVAMRNSINYLKMWSNHSIKVHIDTGIKNKNEKIIQKKNFSKM